MKLNLNDSKFVTTNWNIVNNPLNASYDVQNGKQKVNIAIPQMSRDISPDQTL